MRHYSKANGQFLLAITRIRTRALWRCCRLYSYMVKKVSAMLEMLLIHTYHQLCSFISCSNNWDNEMAEAL
jgi:hypothetical protein